MAESVVAGALPGEGSLASSQGKTSGWSFAHRVIFRFVFCYLLLYIFPFPFGSYPGRLLPFPAYDKMWYALVPWLGKHVLHLSKPITVFPAGSGDTTFNYVQLFSFRMMGDTRIRVLTCKYDGGRYPKRESSRAWGAS